MIYCYVEEGVVKTGPTRLPKKWKNHANFDRLGGPKKAALMKSLGWLEAEKIYAEYDHITHYLDGYIFDIQANKVVVNDNVVAFTRSQLEQNTFNDWHSAMEHSDEDFSRDKEDHINRYHGGVPSDASKGPNKKTDKELYDAKVALRATKPADPVPPKPGEPDYK